MFKTVLGVAAVGLLALAAVYIPESDSPSSFSHQQLPSIRPDSQVESKQILAASDPERHSAIVPGLDELIARARSGDVSAQSRLCSIYMEKGMAAGDYSSAAHWCALAADNGNAASQSLYARLFQLGRGVPKDDQQAFEWYERAARQQNPHALYMLGQILVDKGTPADIARGTSLLQRSAALGSIRATRSLQQMGVPVDERREQPLLIQPDR